MMPSFYFLSKLELVKVLKNPRFILTQTLFISLAFLLYGLSKNTFNSKSFDPYILLIMFVVAHFHARDFVNRFVDTGRLRDIFVSPTALELALPFSIICEIFFVLFGFYINFFILYLLSDSDSTIILHFFTSTTLALLGMISLSYIVAALIKLSDASAYLGLIIVAPLQIPIFIFFLAGSDATILTSLFFLGGVTFFFFSLCLLILPKILQRCL